MQDVTKEIAESQEALKALLPDKEHLVWQVHGWDGRNQERVLNYVQSELSFFEKQEFMTMIGDYVDRFASGEFGIQLADIFGDDVRSQINIPTETSAEDIERVMQDNTDLIKAIVKVFNTLPGLQMKVMLLALGVPPNEREFVETMLGGPALRTDPNGNFYRAALNDEDAFLILRTFITQNAGPIRSFFGEKGRDLVDHFQKEVLPERTEESPNGDTPGGTPSSTSPPDLESTPTPSEDGPPADSSSSTIPSSEER